MTQCAKIVLIVLLLLITPILSSSVRTPYLYFLFNLLLLVLGVESGILTAISRPPEDHRKTGNVSDTTANKLVANDNVGKVAPLGAEEGSTVVVEKTILVEKIKPKKCPSTPSLFFIGGFDGEDGAGQNGVDDGEAEEEEVLSGQELFAKAETFIGNFYKQLKIQREESWRRIHGFYHKAF